MRNELISKVFPAGLVYDDHPQHDPTKRIRRVPPTWWKSQHNRDGLEMDARVAHALWGEASKARYSIIVRRAWEAVS